MLSPVPHQMLSAIKELEADRLQLPSKTPSLEILHLVEQKSADIGQTEADVFCQVRMTPCRGASDVVPKKVS